MNRSQRLQNAHLLYRTCDINILLFDYRGYGKSTGTPSESGLYTDAQAVYDYVRRRNDLNQERIIVFGRSLGGAVALHLGRTNQRWLFILFLMLILHSLASCASRCQSTIALRDAREYLHVDP